MNKLKIKKKYLFIIFLCLLGVSFLYSYNIVRAAVPSIPTNLWADVAEVDYIVWSWKEVSGATFYDIYSDTGAPIESTFSENRYKQSNLSPNTKYSIKVRAGNGEGYSDFSEVFFMYTGSSQPKEGVHEVSVDEYHAHVIWKWVSGGSEKGFEFSNDQSNWIDQKEQVEYAESFLDFDTTYTRYVRSYNEMWASQTVTTLQVTTPKKFINTPPVITSFSNVPDVIEMGDIINFSANWNDIDGHPTELFVCPRNYISTEGYCRDINGYGVNAFCSTYPDFTYNNPLTCKRTTSIYDSLDGNLPLYTTGVNYYYVFVCDSYACGTNTCHSCSQSSQGVFTASSPSPIISGVYWQFSTQDSAEPSFTITAQSPIYTVATNEPNSTKNLITLTSLDNFSDDVNLSFSSGNECIAGEFEPVAVQLNPGSKQTNYSSFWIKTNNCTASTIKITITGTPTKDPAKFKAVDLSLGIVTPPAPIVEETTRAPFWRQIIPW